MLSTFECNWFNLLYSINVCY